MLKTVLEVIEAVEKIFVDPSKWTQLYYARDANGQQISEINPQACCYCLAGCIIHLTPRPDYPRAGMANEVGNRTLLFLEKTMQKHYGSGLKLHQWNDDADRTIEQVRGLLHVAKEDINRYNIDPLALP